MRKKLFAALAILLTMAMVLSGCGGGGSASVPAIDSPSASAENEQENTDIEQPDASMDTTELDEPDTSEPDNVLPSESSTEDALSGLILLTGTPKSSAYVFGDVRYTIQCLDLDTGEVTDIAQFDFGPDETFQYTNTDQRNIYANQRDRFSPNYDKLAITATFKSDLSVHAGWIDESGQFFDVTEALGLAPQGDFSDPVYYYARGFAEDGSFVFQQCSSKGYSVDGPCYYIDPDNLDPAAIKDGNPYRWQMGGTVTDWIDETHCLVDNWGFSMPMIMDIETEEKTSYLPSNSRKSWDGVISPDGERIAFLSRPQNGNELPSIYIVPIDGGDPVKVDSAFPFTYNEYEVDKNNGFTAIIDWR